MFEILGFEKMSFPSKETGELVSGIMIYLLGDDVQEKLGKGRCVITKFFTESKIKGELEVGKIAEFIIRFTPKGEAQVCGIKIS